MSVGCWQEAGRRAVQEHIVIFITFELFSNSSFVVHFFLLQQLSAKSAQRASVFSLGARGGGLFSGSRDAAREKRFFLLILSLLTP